MTEEFTTAPILEAKAEDLERAILGAVPASHRPIYEPVELTEQIDFVEYHPGVASGMTDLSMSEPYHAPLIPSERPISTTPRNGTIVWGLLVAAVGALILIISAGARVDPGLATIGLLAAAGTALILTSIFAAMRRKRRNAG